MKRGEKVAVSISYSGLYWALEEEVISVPWAELPTDHAGENGKRPVAAVLQSQSQKLKCCPPPRGSVYSESMATA